MAKALACKATFDMIADKARHLKLAEIGLLGGLVFPEAVDLGVMEIVRVYLNLKEMSDWVAEDSAEAHWTHQNMDVSLVTASAKMPTADFLSERAWHLDRVVVGGLR